MKDKTILITGGNDGIGLVTARLFSRLGANVAIIGRRSDKNESARKEIAAEGGQCLALTGDVSKESDVINAVAETFKQFGSLHYAFNNAGGEGGPKPIMEQTEEEYYSTTDVHIKGTWLCMKHEIPYLLKSGGGAIVNNSSAAGHSGTLMMPIYSACKHAMIGLTKSVALEFAKRNIRVNAVCPGATWTPGYAQWAASDPDMTAAVIVQHAMGRVAQSEEVAAAVLYLCRDATFTTGSSLMVDGGYLA